MIGQIHNAQENILIFSFFFADADADIVIMVIMWDIATGNQGGRHIGSFVATINSLGFVFFGVFCLFCFAFLFLFFLGYFVVFTDSLTDVLLY